MYCLFLGELITAKKEKNNEKPSNKKKGKSSKLINVVRIFV